MTTKVFGFIAVMLGIAALMYGGFTYAYPDNVANVGPVHVSVQKHASVLVPPMIGALILAGGVAILAMPTRKA